MVKLDKNLKNMEKDIKKANKEKKYSEVVKLNILFAQECSLKGHSTRVITAIAEAFGAVKKVGFSKEFANLFFEAGNNFKEMKWMVNANYLFSKALSIAEGVNDTDLIEKIKNVSSTGKREPNSRSSEIRKTKISNKKISEIRKFETSKDKSSEYLGVNHRDLDEDFDETKRIARLLSSQGHLSKANRYHEKFIWMLESYLPNSPKPLLEISDSLHEIGINFINLKDYDKSIKYIKKSLEVEIKTGNIDNILLKINNLGTVYLLNKNYKLAFEKFILFKNRSEDLGKNVIDTVPPALKVMAGLGVARDDEEKKMLKKLIEMPKISYEILDDIALADSSYKQKNFEGAISKFQKIIVNCMKTDEKRGELKARYGLGKVFTRQNELIKAIEEHELALDLSRKLYDVYEESIQLRQIAGIYRNMKNYEKSFEYQKEAVKVLKRSEYTIRLSQIESELEIVKNLIILNKDMNEPLPKGLKKEQDINQNLGDDDSKYYGRFYAYLPRTSKELVDISKNSKEMGDYLMVIKCYEMMISLFERELEERPELKKDISIMLNQIGKTYSSLFNFNDAIPYFQKSLEIVYELKLDVDLIFSNRSNLGFSYLCIKQFDFAFEQYQEFTRLSKVLGAIIPPDIKKNIDDTVAMISQNSIAKKEELYKILGLPRK